MASPVSVPNSFTAATDAVSTEVNANFSALVNYINNNMVTSDGAVAITGTQAVENVTASGTVTAANVNGDFKGDLYDTADVKILDNTTGAATFTGNVTGDVSGNAGGTATALATARAINGVDFDGTAAITVTAAADTLTGSTLASGVTTSSLTSVGTIADLQATKVTVGATGLFVNAAGFIEFGNDNDRITYDDANNQWTFTADGNNHFQIGGTATANDVVTKATGTFKAYDSGAQFPTGSGTNAHIITAFGLSALIKESSVAADKENIQPVGSWLTPDMIDSVEPKLWNRKNAPGHPEIGPIADEIELVSEFLATHGTDAEGNQLLMGVSHTAWMSLITLAIQDIRTRLAALEA
jgi:hypothetical protein